jgi:TetR/AcrR family transcriptional regulator, cholesterol catabolism regulator
MVALPGSIQSFARNYFSGGRAVAEKRPGPGSYVTPDGIAQRRQRRRELLGDDDKRVELVEAAARVFSRLGYAEASLNDVAQELGVNRATLYYYVESKADLLAQVIGEPLQRMMKDIRAAADAESTAIGKIRAIVAAHIRSLVTGYTGLDLLFAQKDIRRFGDEGQLVWNEGVYYATFIDAIFKAGQEAGEIRDDISPHIATLALTGMLNWLHRWYDGSQDVDEIIGQFTTIFLTGVVPPADVTAGPGAG